MLATLITIVSIQYIRSSSAITAADFKALCLAQSPNVYLEDKCYTLTVSCTAQLHILTNHAYSHRPSTTRTPSPTVHPVGLPILAMVVWAFCQHTVLLIWLLRRWVRNSSLSTVGISLTQVPAGNYWVALHQNDTAVEPDGNWYWEDTVNGEQYGILNKSIGLINQYIGPLSTRDEGGLPWGPSGRVEPNDGKSINQNQSIKINQSK